MPNQPTSVSLLHRIQIGQNDESWYEFISVYKRLIEGWLVRQGVSANDADDIQQEVIATVLNEITSFDHNGRTGAFRNWLRKITVNRLREFWRKQNRQPSANDVDLNQLAMQLDDASSELSQIWDKEHQQHLLDHLLIQISRQFKPKSMEAFRQVVIEQRPIELVSKDLQLSINAIRIAQSRILRALRNAGQGLIEV